MKAIGFLKIHNPEIVCAGDIAFNSHVIDNTTLERVISYLQKGVIINAFTLSLFDTDKEFIGPYMILSDGEWIWPSYYSFYLKKYNLLYTPQEFILHTTVNKEKTNELTKEELLYTEYIVAKLIGVNPKSLFSNPALKKLIADNGEDIQCFRLASETRSDFL